jgi:hypothetical protein
VVEFQTQEFAASMARGQRNEATTRASAAVADRRYLICRLPGFGRRIRHQEPPGRAAHFGGATGT